MSGKDEALASQRPWIARVRSILEGGDRRLSDVAPDADVSVGRLYDYLSGSAILPGFRLSKLVPAAGSARVALAEHVIDARAARLVVVEADVGSGSMTLVDGAMQLTVDVAQVVAAIHDASSAGSEGGERITLGELHQILDRLRVALRTGHDLERVASDRASAPGPTGSEPR